MPPFCHQNQKKIDVLKELCEKHRYFEVIIIATLLWRVEGRRLASYCLRYAKSLLQQGLSKLSIKIQVKLKKIKEFLKLAIGQLVPAHLSLYLLFADMCGLRDEVLCFKNGATVNKII